MGIAPGLGERQEGLAFASSLVPAGERETARGLRATIERAPVGIAHFDAHGRFLLVNEKLCELLACDRDVLLQSGFAEFTFPEDVAGCVELNRRLAAREIPSYSVDKRLVRRDGSPLWSRVCVSALHEPGGDLAFFVAIVEDISAQQAEAEQRRAAEERLQALLLEVEERNARLLRMEHEARETAEQLARRREEIVANVGHDLRNPLHVIATAVAAMQSPALPQQQRASLAATLQRNLRRMNRLLNDLLDLSRIDSGRLSIERVPVDVAALMAEVRESFEPDARAVAIAFTCEAPGGIGAVAGDHDRLCQVLSNLVGNSLKFTPPGGHIAVHAEGRDGHVEFSVHDDGPGLDPAQLQHLFVRYWKARPASTTGTGLGLAIAKGIVEAHGGRIRAESEPGHGTVIRFSIPRAVEP